MKRFFIMLAAVLSATSMTLAHGDEIHVMGTVSKIEGTTVLVKTTDGSTKSVVLDPETKFLKNNVAVKRDDLKVGDRVVIHAKELSNALHATEVKIGVAPKATNWSPINGFSITQEVAESMLPGGLYASGNAVAAKG